MQFYQSIWYQIFIVILIIFSFLLEYWIMNYKPKYIRYNNYIQVAVIIILGIDIILLFLWL